MKKISLKGASWDSFFLTAVKIVTTLSTIILTKILSTGLSLTQYGTYSSANVVVSLGVSFLLLGFGDAINYFYNNKSEGTDEKQRITYVNTIFFLEIIIGIVFSIAVIFGRGLIVSYFSNELLNVVLIIVSIKPMLDNLMFFYQVLYVSIGKSKIIAVRNLVITLLKIVIMYISVYVLKDIVWIFVCLIALDLLQLLFFKFHFGKEGFLVNPFKISKSLIKPIIAYGLPMGVFALTTQFSREIGKLIIGRLADTETLAIYTNCSKILPFDIIVTSFATVLIPYIMQFVSGQKKDEAVKLFQNYMKIGYYSVWILGTAVLITSGQVLALLYSEEYMIGKPIFVIYIIDSMLKFASMHLILTSSGKSKLLMVYSIMSLGLNAVSNIVFYYLFGIIGPAIATLIVTVLYTFLVLRSSVKILNTKWREIFDFKDMFAFIICLAITGVVFFIINTKLLDFGVNQYIAMFISAGGFGIINLLINFKKIMNALKAVNSLRL